MSRAVTHKLIVYVPEAARGETLTAREIESRDRSVFILKYFAARKKFLAPMGVEISVLKVRKADLQRPAILQGFAQKRVTSLPALVTPANTYCAAGAIMKIYDGNIEAFQLKARQKEAEIGGIHRETDAEEYYRSIMTFEKAANDDKEDDPFEDGATGDQIMSGVEKMMAHRQAAQDRYKGGRKREGDAPLKPAAAPKAAGKGRGNVKTSSIDNLIQQVGSREIGYDDVFGGGASDSAGESSRAGDARDNLIERAFLENMEDSSQL